MATIQKYLLAALGLVIVFSSCQPSKKVHQDRLYLRGIDTALVTTVKMPEPKIQKGDKISLIVFSDNASASSFYNLGSSGGDPAAAGAVDAGGNSQANGGYLVDGEGNILMRGLGPVHADGFSKLQFKQLVQDKLDTLLKHPYVEVRFLNKRVTILGEVARPGIINLPEERLNLFDAIALSGDLTTFARNDNILVIREENGRRTAGRLNVKDPGIYKSDFFYLHKDDLVYIEPIRKKPTGTDQTLVRNVSLAASLISVLAILYSVFRNN